MRMLTQCVEPPFSRTKDRQIYPGIFVFVQRLGFFLIMARPWLLLYKESLCKQYLDRSERIKFALNVEVWVILTMIVLGKQALQSGNQAIPQKLVLSAGGINTGLGNVNLRKIYKAVPCQEMS